MEMQEPVSPSSRIFHEQRVNCYIVVMIGSAKRIDVGVVREGLRATLVQHPRFTNVQVFDGEGDGRRGEARWIQKEFCIDDHIVVPELDSSIIDDADVFVEDFVSSLSADGCLDPSRPLWDLHILNLKTSDAEATAVFRIHHSLGDGTSLVSLVLASTRRTSDPASLPSAAKEPKLRQWRKKPTRGLRGLLPWLALMATIAWNTVVGLAAFVATLVFLKDGQTPLKGKEGVEVGRKRFLRRTFLLEDLKAVKCSVEDDHVTLNDVLLGIVYSGLARFVCRSGGDSKSRYSSQKARLRSTLFFNTRKASKSHASNSSEAGNHIGFVILTFPIVKYDNPFNYIKDAKALVDQKKSSLEVLFAFSFAKLAARFFGFKVVGAMFHRVLSSTTFLFSNVMGPSEQIGFHDHPMVYIAPTLYGLPQALSIHFFSYMGKMMMVLAVDEATIPDPHQLCNDIMESFNLMKKMIAKGA